MCKYVIAYLFYASMTVLDEWGLISAREGTFVFIVTSRLNQGLTQSPTQHRMGCCSTSDQAVTTSFHTLSVLVCTNCPVVPYCQSELLAVSIGKP